MSHLTQNAWLFISRNGKHFCLLNCTLFHNFISTNPFFLFRSHSSDYFTSYVVQFDLYLFMSHIKPSQIFTITDHISLVLHVTYVICNDFKYCYWKQIKAKQSKKLAF